MRARIVSRRPSMRRVSEYFLLIAGLLLLDWFVWVKASAVVYQAWESWSFDREVNGESVSVGEFLREELRLGRRAQTSTAPGAAAPGSAMESNRAQALRPRIPASDVVGRLEIPRLGLRAIVREGADESTLKRAVGHLPTSPLPGESGNVAVAGHRDTFFRPLQRIKPRDRITFETLHGRYEYEVESVRVVHPDDVSVLRASASPTLTLVTCYPFYYIGSAPERFIVHARQIGAAPELERASVSAPGARAATGVQTLPGL